MNSPCPECHAYHRHCVTCSLQTLEERAAKMEEYYGAWLNLHDLHHKLCVRLREQVTLWQGKCAILRRENNALRRKVVPRDKTQPQPYDGPTIETMKIELIEGGWKPWRHKLTIWQSPEGTLHRGPEGAWRVMRSSLSSED